MKVLRFLVAISALLFAAIIRWSVIIFDSVERKVVLAECGKGGDGIVFYFVTCDPPLSAISSI